MLMFLYSHSKFKDSCYRDLNYHLTFCNIFIQNQYIYIHIWWVKYGIKIGKS